MIGIAMLLAWILICIAFVVWSAGKIDDVLRWIKHKKDSSQHWLRRNR